MPEVTTDELAVQRQKIEEAIQRMRGFYDTNAAAQGLANFYNTPESQTLFGQVQGRAAGQDSPFSANLISSLIADSTSANARGVSRDSDMIRRMMANSGLSGSGLETSALVNARRGATAQTTAARRDITSRAELANYQAKVAAQQEVNQMLQQRLAAQQELVAGQRNQANQADAQDINYRSQFREITPQPGGTGQASSSGGSWVDRWNQGQINYLTQVANGVTNRYGAGQGVPWSAGMVGQANADSAYARDRLNQLLAGF